MAALLAGCGGLPQRQAEPPAGPDSVDSAEDRSDTPTLMEPLPGDAPESASAETDPPPAPDVWERLRRGFRLSPPDDPRMARELQRIADNPRLMEQRSRRAVPYLHFIVEEAERRGIPLEIALLPAIESGFRPDVRSPGNALGLWQFMPATADSLGLKRLPGYEGRCDVTASTRAALDYLEQLADLFGGDWELALAAYNAGPGTVQRAIRVNRQQGLDIDFWSLPLPDHTRQYVPRLLAVAKAVEEPESLGVQLAPIPDEPFFTEIEVPRRIDLDLVEDLAELDGNLFSRLNPAFRDGRMPAEGPNTLLLPIGQAETFEEKLADLRDMGWPNCRTYRVRRGDSLDRIARRHDVSVAALMRVNALSGNLIREGQELLIPDGSAAPDPRTAAPAAEGPPGDMVIADQAHRGDPEPARVMAVRHQEPTPQAEQGADSRAEQLLTYQVKPGDSLYRIARRFGIAVADLKRWNGLRGSGLKIGQRLTVHLSTRLTTPL